MPAFWNKKWGKDAICPITHCKLRPGKNKHGIPHTIRLQCSHRFYRTALYKWIKTSTKKNQTCPICRRKLLLIDLTTLKN